MSWYYWILIIIGLTFIGYLYNRIVFWIGAFFWQCGSNIMFSDKWWFEKNTTIEDFICDVKYVYGIAPSPGFEKYADYNDSYNCAYMVRWIPGLNILVSTFIFGFNILRFLIGLLTGLLKILIWFITDILWKYILKYVFNSIVWFIKKIYHILEKTNIISFISYIKNVSINIKNKILNIRIA